MLRDSAHGAGIEGVHRWEGCEGAEMSMLM